jgi:hypothetical protein
VVTLPRWLIVTAREVFSWSAWGCGPVTGSGMASKNNYKVNGQPVVLWTMLRLTEPRSGLAWKIL